MWKMLGCAIMALLFMPIPSQAQVGIFAIRNGGEGVGFRARLYGGNGCNGGQAVSHVYVHHIRERAVHGCNGGQAQAYGTSCNGGNGGTYGYSYSYPVRSYGYIYPQARCVPPTAPNMQAQPTVSYVGKATGLMAFGDDKKITFQSNAGTRMEVLGPMFANVQEGRQYRITIRPASQ